MIKGRCVAKGLHHLLLEENTEHKWSILGCLVAIVLSLEQYNPAEGIGGLLEEDPSSKNVSTTGVKRNDSPVVDLLLKNRSTIEGCERSLTKFFAKRITCSCLAEKYSKTKAQDKTSLCRFCKERKKRNSLMVCSICRDVSYCSRQCQVADWPCHKEYCEGDFF